MASVCAPVSLRCGSRHVTSLPGTPAAIDGLGVSPLQRPHPAHPSIHPTTPRRRVTNHKRHESSALALDYPERASLVPARNLYPLAPPAPPAPRWALFHSPSMAGGRTGAVGLERRRAASRLHDAKTITLWWRNSVWALDRRRSRQPVQITQQGAGPWVQRDDNRLYNSNFPAFITPF